MGITFSRLKESALTALYCRETFISRVNPILAINLEYG